MRWWRFTRSSRRLLLDGSYDTVGVIILAVAWLVRGDNKKQRSALLTTE